MTDPLSLTPFALAAGAGAVDGFECRRLVAAGLGLLQRAAPLVRALAGRRSGVLLPPSHRWLTALAASEGRAAVVLDADAAADLLSAQIEHCSIGAVFTLSAFGQLLPPGLRVYLDDAPERCVLHVSGVERAIDLTSHQGLDLEGDPDAPGSRAEVLHFPGHKRDTLGETLTHEDVLLRGRAVAHTLDATASDQLLTLLPFTTASAVVEGLVGPLLTGCRVSCMESFDPVAVLTGIDEGQVTMLVGTPDQLTATRRLIISRGAAWKRSALRACYVSSGPGNMLTRTTIDTHTTGESA